MNKARVDVGTSPPIDLVSAQAELASNEEQLIIAETAVKEAEDRLRVLILDTTQRDAWTVALDASIRHRLASGRRTPTRRLPPRCAIAPICSRARKDIETVADDAQVHRQSAAAGCSPERELPGQRAWRHAGACGTGSVSPARSSDRASRRRSRRCWVSCSGAIIRRGRWRQRVVSARPERGRSQSRPRPARERADAGTAEERRSEGDAAGARRGLEDRA